MKTYTIYEEVVNYQHAEIIGQKYNKIAGREEVSTQQAWTKEAMKLIEMYAGNISPFTLKHDEFGRVVICELYIPINELQAKNITIIRN